jgi:Domain of unknown function (DUF4145)
MTTTKAHCNACDGERNHVVLHVEESRWTNEEHGFTGRDTWAMLKCSGCDSVKLRNTSWDSETDGAKSVYFPPATFRRQPRWMLLLWAQLAPEDVFVEELLQEVYVAFYQGLTRLATMGIRSLIERIMISKIGDQQSFIKNMSEFERLGYVSNIQRARLDTLLDAGHAAIHRAYSPTTQDVHTLLDITEHIVEAVYVHGDKVAELRKNIPVRKPKE